MKPSSKLNQRRRGRRNAVLLFILVGTVFCSGVAVAEPFDIPCGKLSGDDEPTPAGKRQD